MFSLKTVVITMYSTKDIVRAIEQKLTNLKDMLKGLQRCNLLVDEFLLENVSWNIRNEPSAAIELVRDEKGKLKDGPKVNLSKELFHSPISLVLQSRYGDESYQEPVFGGKIYNVFTVIHKFYQNYEVTHDMGDGIWFEGLRYVSPTVWLLILGS